MFKEVFYFLHRKKDPVGFFRKQGVLIGEECEIRCSSFGSEPYLVSIGNHVRINSGVRFVTHDGGVWVLRRCSKLPNCEKIDKFGGVTVGNNVHIGNDAIIMPGVTIGNNVIIGCGAVVTHDIPSNSVAVGIPARVIETIEEYEQKNKDKFEYTKFMSKNEKREYLIKKYKN